MATRKPAPASASDPAAEVAQWFAALVHPHADGLALLRRTILAADPAITEGIKWNVPSFRTVEWFATFHVRTKTGFALILHLGAKKREDLPAGGLASADPGGMLKWLGPDRAMLEFADRAALEAKAPALQALVRCWIGFVAGPPSA